MAYKRRKNKRMNSTEFNNNPINGFNNTPINNNGFMNNPYNSGGGGGYLNNNPTNNPTNNGGGYLNNPTNNGGGYLNNNPANSNGFDNNINSTGNQGNQGNQGNNKNRPRKHKCQQKQPVSNIDFITPPQLVRQTAIFDKYKKSCVANEVSKNSNTALHQHQNEDAVNKFRNIITKLQAKHSKGDSAEESNIFIKFPHVVFNTDLNETILDDKPSQPNTSTYFDDIKDDDLTILKKEVNTIDDIIALGKTYDPSETKKYTLNLEILKKLIEPLEKLKLMIGMTDIKNTIVDLILYNIQNFEVGNSSMLHTIIEGSPGTGKTEVAKIIGEIYLKMGILKSSVFKAVKRTDLIGQYLGHTADKTQRVIDEAKGGILFIDEAYSLGNPDGKDSYSKECIDILNQNLSEEKCNFVCIIAGYADELKKSFFSYNIGLERRFPYRFSIKNYTDEELRDIFIKLVKEYKWGFKEDFIPPVAFFNKNKSYFKYFGGDLENYFNSCRIAHARRAMTIPVRDKKKLTESDLNKGLLFFIQNDEIKKRKEDVSISDMYL